MPEPTTYLTELFSLKGQVAVVTGATGVLGGAIAQGLAQAGAKVGVLGRREAQAKTRVREIEAAGGEALALVADVLQRDQLEQARQAILARWGRIDILVNAAGGNTAEASVSPDGEFFTLAQEAMQSMIDLNLMGTLLPCQVFGVDMAQQKKGSIINISSLSVPRALTRAVAYSAAKAGIENFTRWLAIELMHKYGAGLRVNAIAPGFFVGDQNRQLLLNDDQSLTGRGQTIIDRTPAGRFGEPEELVGVAIWLCSPSASFVSGIVVEVDGGFGVFSGV